MERAFFGYLAKRQKICYPVFVNKNSAEEDGMQFGGVSGRKLLFIDDESDVTAEYSRYFGERGNSVRIAASLAEAAGLLEKA